MVKWLYLSATFWYEIQTGLLIIYIYPPRTFYFLLSFLIFENNHLRKLEIWCLKCRHIRRFSESQVWLYIVTNFFIKMCLTAPWYMCVYLKTAAMLITIYIIILNLIHIKFTHHHLHAFSTASILKWISVTLLKILLISIDFNIQVVI